MNRWVAGARPRTLPAAVVPVLVGTGVAAGDAVPGSGVVAWRAGAALVVALALQVGTNFANDYSDGVRGTDDRRVGPRRLVASGLAAPHLVKRAAALAFAVAALAGLALVAAVGPELLLVGAASILAGILYTGGPRPYGYAGLGEVAVFCFFGLVAVAGTAYVQLERLPGLAVAAGVPVGLVATALLVANNLRDVDTDAIAGKRTLAVRLGAPATRRLYGRLLGGALVAVPLLALARPWVLVALAAVPLARRLDRRVRDGATGLDLIGVLAGTARLHLVLGVLLAFGLAMGR